MRHNEIEIYDNLEAIGDRLAEFLLAASSGSKSLVLPGGNTPRQIFDHLTGSHPELPWDHMDYYWGDERMVPPDHPDSNYLMARIHLFDRIHPDNRRIHRIHGEDDPHHASIAYAEEIKKNIEFHGGYPRFDMVLLGMGEDGHTASIFPGQPLVDTGKGKKICKHVHHPLTGQERITLTLPVLNNAREVIFLVTGHKKSRILADILNEKKSAETLPAYHIHPEEGKLYWLLDREASLYL